MKPYLQGIAYALLIPFSTLVSASYIYTYTGNTFDSIYDSPVIEGTYDTTHRVVFSFATAAPLSPNLVWANANNELDVLGYSAEDGRQRLTSSGFSYLNLAVSTDSSGVITSWSALTAIEPTLSGTIQRVVSTSSNNGDYGQQTWCTTASVKWRCEEYGGGDDAFTNSGSTGDWTVTTGVWNTPDPIHAVPIPPSLLLFASGMLGLIGFGRYRKAVWRS